MTQSLALPLAVVLLLGASAPTGGRPSAADPYRANLSCLDRATQVAIRIENGSRDTNRLRPCG